MAVLRIPPEAYDVWNSFIDKVRSGARSLDVGLGWPYGRGALEGLDIPGPTRFSTQVLLPDTLEHGIESGIVGLNPAVIHANYRSMEAIRRLRKLMAEEMGSRGPIKATGPATDISKVFSPEWLMSREGFKELYDKYGGLSPGFMKDISLARELYAKPVEGGTDPIEQILRGTWYHGSSAKARRKAEVWPLEKAVEITRGIPEQEQTLRLITEGGFPISLHDAASISNKLGEPAGVSISMLPTKAKQFSADEYIHRVLPLYGASPAKRTVNLMTQEGRNALNDAYDVVANRLLANSDILEGLAANLGGIGHVPMSYIPESVRAELMDLSRMIGERGIGPFNKALSDQLQSQGYRGILYNPRRWDEYEMLMLDPKYLLPLDYRKVGEYPLRTSKNLNTAQALEDAMLGRAEERATPGIQKGLNQIQDLMSQNASRLGDIYRERPWTQRLSEENKQRLLELIDPEYRELVGKQLYEGRAFGGPVDRGNPFVVGELGPELYVPSGSNDNQELSKLMGILNQNKNLEYVRRILAPYNSPVKVYDDDGTIASHMMMYSDHPGGRGYISFPSIINDEEGFRELSPDEAYRHAVRSRQYIQHPTREEADWFSKNYKKVWGPIQ